MDAPTDAAPSRSPQTAAIIAIDDLEALKAAGIHWPKTADAWRWTYRRRAENGLAAAFHKVGTRVLVDPVKFLELVRKGRAS